MIQRPRRLRGNAVLRKMVRETRVDKSSLVYPIFVREGENIREEIPTMPGQYRYSVDQMPFKLEALKRAGVGRVIFFGIPDKKDEMGSGAYDEDGIVQKALREARKQFGMDLYLITDVCMCEYTSHGHCGLLCGHEVDNDPTLLLLAKTALSHAQAGADMVAPSDMMDGRVLAIRNELDQNHFTNVPIMSYAVKYASGFYGPFRDAAGSAPAFGDRKSYQMDFHNRKEGIKEALRSGYSDREARTGLSGHDPRGVRPGRDPCSSLQCERRICHGKGRGKAGLYRRRANDCRNGSRLFPRGCLCLSDLFCGGDCRTDGSGNHWLMHEGSDIAFNS